MSAYSFLWPWTCISFTQHVFIVV